LMEPARQDFLRRPSKARKRIETLAQTRKNCENDGKSASESPVDYRRCLLQENDRKVKIPLNSSRGPLSIVFRR